MTKSVRILLIEDSEDDAILLQRQLTKSNLEIEMKRICTCDEMIQALNENTWDAIICDYLMPEFSVTDAMEVLRTKGVDLPFIIVSGTISDETAVDMMKAGAHDYLTVFWVTGCLKRLLRRRIDINVVWLKRRFARVSGSTECLSNQSSTP